MSSFVPLPTGQTVIEGSPSSRIGSFFHRWLTDFRAFVGFGVVPVGCIVSAVLTSAQVAALFDSDGLGKTGRFQGWQICNGNNGSPDLDATFLRWAVAESGGVGGSDSSAHTHAAGDLVANIRVSAASGKILAESIAHDFTSDAEVALGGITDVAGSSANATVIDGTTDAASATDNRPAYYELVPLLRVA